MAWFLNWVHYNYHKIWKICQKYVQFWQDIPAVWENNDSILLFSYMDRKHDTGSLQQEPGIYTEGF